MSDVAKNIVSRFAYEPREASAELLQSWRLFAEDGVVGDNVRSVIADSWRRSLESSVDFELDAVELNEPALKGFDDGAAMRKHFREAGTVVVNGLAEELAGTNSAVVACDARGLMVHRAGDSDILGRTGELNFVPSGLWGETAGGTNGIGLALALGRTAFVFGSEHFCEKFQPYVCTATPVRHPVTREILGVIDVSTDYSGMNVHTGALTSNAARDIERLLEERIFGRERELLERYLHGRTEHPAPFMTVDRAGHTIIQNAAMLQTISGDDLDVLVSAVRVALPGGEDFTDVVELSRGPRLVRVQLVRTQDEIIGALVAVEPIRGGRAIRSEPERDRTWAPLTGKSACIRTLLHQAAAVADRRAPVVVTGEPGIGKLRLARAMHERAMSSTATLQIVNCSHADWRSAWTWAATEADTVILRGVATLEVREQLELADHLDDLQDREAPPWTMAILPTDVASLRLELLHRLGSVTLRVPSLAERAQDFQLLITEWCAQRAEPGRPQPIVRVDARDALAARCWPGNVRELFNALDTALLKRGSIIGPGVLDLPDQPAGQSASGNLRNMERNAIVQALNSTGGNVSQAARDLGISRATLHRRLRAYRLLSG